MVLALVLACAHPVDITLTAAEIAPTTADGKAWDGPNSLDPAAKGLLDSALAKIDPSGQLSGSLGSATEKLQKPDPAGTLFFLAGDGSPPTTADVPEASDTLTPTWAPGVGTLRNVMWSPKASLDVTVIDKDVSSDDPIGRVRLTAAQLSAAEARDGAFTIDVADATSGQLRSVSVVVVKSPTP